MDAVQWHVLDATADDWESIEQIEDYVRYFHESVARRDIAKIILKMVEDGLFEEMRGLDVGVIQLLSEPTEFWFQMTPEGRREWDSIGPQYRGEE